MAVVLFLSGLWGAWCPTTKPVSWVWILLFGSYCLALQGTSSHTLPCRSKQLSPEAWTEREQCSLQVTAQQGLLSGGPVALEQAQLSSLCLLSFCWNNHLKGVLVQLKILGSLLSCPCRTCWRDSFNPQTECVLQIRPLCPLVFQ